MEYAKKMGHDGVIRSSTDGMEIILPFDNKSIKILNNNVNMEQHMENKQDLTEKDFVFNGRKDWRLFKEAISQKMLLDAAEKLKGGMADNKTLEDIAKKHNVGIKELEKELQSGIKVETEHGDDEVKAKRTAMDHLWERPDYYTKLAKCGLEEPYEAPIKENLLGANNNTSTQSQNQGKDPSQMDPAQYKKYQDEKAKLDKSIDKATQDLQNLRKQRAILAAKYGVNPNA
jgi:hypothetical protein